MKDFFGKLGGLYGRLNLFSKPIQIFNLDESGISTVYRPGKKFTELGRKNVRAVTSGECGKTHTLLVCVSASGFVMSPMMIYPRKRIADSLKKAAPGTMFACTDNGWIDQATFVEWFKFFTAVRAL